MMTPPTQAPEPTAAAGVQLRAAEWLMEQNEAGHWDEASQANLDHWLAESPAHLLAYWRLKAAWQRTHRLAALQTKPIGAHRISQPRSRWTRKLGLSAASAVVAAMGAWWFVGSSPAQEKIYSTPIGGHEIVSLADGSRIELNTNTEVRVRPEGRAVELVRGEAFFQIRHDNRRPFTVLAKGHRVTDLGTKFLVRAERQRLTVTLLDGSIRFESVSGSARPHSEVLEPGDVAVATRDSVSVIQRSRQAVADAAAWRKGMLVFRDKTLAAAAEEFNRYNNERIVVEGTHASKVKIDGTFRADNIVGFANMVQHVFDLKVRKHTTGIAISD